MSDAVTQCLAKEKQWVHYSSVCVPDPCPSIQIISLTAADRSSSSGSGGGGSGSRAASKLSVRACPGVASLPATAFGSRKHLEEKALVTVRPMVPRGEGQGGKQTEGNGRGRRKGERKGQEAYRHPCL